MSRVHEGDHDVSGAPGGGQALVTVGEARGAAEDVPGQSCQRLIGEVVQSRRMPLLGPSPG